MSRILRRPMFRGGGKVSSYGTGIASGLAKPKRGLVDEPGGYAGYSNLAQFLAEQATKFKPGVGTVGTSTTGGNILSQNVRPIQGPPVSPQMQAIENRLASSGINTARNRFVQGALNAGGRFMGTFPTLSTIGLTGAAFAPVGIMAAANAPETVEALEYMKKMNETGIFDETANPDDVTNYYKTLEELNKTGTPLEEKGVGLTTGKEDLEKIIKEQTEAKKDKMDKIEDLTTTVDTDSNGNVEQKPELTAEEMVKENKELFARLMGRDKAIKQDIGDVLGAFSRGALKGDWKEGLAEATKVESRKEKIDLQAAALAINDYIAGKRSKENLNQVLSQIDYKIAKELGAQKLTGDWISDLKKVQARYRDEDLRSNTVISDALFESTGQSASVKSFPKLPMSKIDPKDLAVGLNIVTAKDGRKIIQKSSTGEIRDLSSIFPI